MKKPLAFIKKQKFYFGVGAILLLLVVYFAFIRGNSSKETFTVARTTVSQSVALSGKVQTTDRADLGFAAAGRVGNILVKNNQTVEKGRILAQLEIGDLLADLHIKQAALQTSNVDLDNARDNLEKITEREDTKVENAHRNLLSDDLTLEPSSITYTLTAPTISGIYTGAEGQYRVSFSKERNDLRLRVLTFGLENTSHEANYEGQTPLGSKGLYVTFPVKDPSAYDNTSWTIDIPNKSGSSYLANYNAYNSAQVDRDIAVKSAKADYDKLLSAGDNGSSVAQSEIEKINAEIRKNTIYAPFTGKVTNIEKEVGENASVGERVVSILGEGQLEIVLQVSELDVPKISPGMTVKIKLDAIPGEEFTGTVQSINSRDTQVEGVPVYEAFVEVAPDDRIKTGMTATADIALAERDSVLAIPSYYVSKDGARNYVNVVTGKGGTAEREVALGLVGTDSMVEVLSGLAEGDKIVATVKK